MPARNFVPLGVFLVHIIFSHKIKEKKRTPLKGALFVAIVPQGNYFGALFSECRVLQMSREISQI